MSRRSGSPWPPRMAVSTFDPCATGVGARLSWRLTSQWEAIHVRGYIAQLKHGQRRYLSRHGRDTLTFRFTHHQLGFRAEPRGSHTIWPASLASQTSIAHPFIPPPSFTGASLHLLPQVSLISPNIPVCENFRAACRSVTQPQLKDSPR